MRALATQAPADIVRPHLAPIQTIAYGPAILATGDTERQVCIWRDGRPQMRLDLRSRQDKIRPTERIRGLAFSPDGGRLYAACGDLLRAYDCRSGELLWAYRPPRSFGFLIISPICLAVSSLGDVAMATDAGRMGVWTPGGAIRSRWADNDSPRSLAFLDPERLIGTDSFSVAVWRAETGRKLSRRSLQDRAFGMAVSPDGKWACLRSTRSAELLDVETLETVREFSIGFGLPLVALSGDSRLLAVGHRSGAEVYHVSGEHLHSIALEGVELRSMRFAPDRLELAAGCSDGSLRFWNLGG